MCTCGVLAITGRTDEPIFLMAKTLDYPPSSLWRGILSEPNGFTTLGFGLVEQSGVNGGVNERGLGLMMTYGGSDETYADRFDSSESSRPIAFWQGDYRGLINAFVLAHCSTVDEAITAFYHLLPFFPNQPGGNHFLLDSSGNIAVVEHLHGALSHQYYSGLTCRANDQDLIQAQRLSPNVAQDRIIRRRRIEKVMGRLCNAADEKCVEKSSIIMTLEDVLAWHNPNADTLEGLGSICCHGLSLPGARANLTGSLQTLTGVIIDVADRALRLTVGFPCKKIWHEYRFGES